MYPEGHSILLTPRPQNASDVSPDALETSSACPDVHTPSSRVYGGLTENSRHEDLQAGNCASMACKTEQKGTVF